VTLTGRRRTASLRAVACLAVLVGCASSPSEPTAVGTTPPATSAAPAVTLPPATVPPPATSAPTTTIDLTSLLADTTTTASTIPPPGNPIPGGPVRAKPVPQPVPAGPCTETAGHVDRLTFQSNVLAINQPVQHYRVYTPKCYRYDVGTRYPVVYLFHGAQTDDSQWEAVGIFTTADRLIASGAIVPMIIVLPDGIWAMGTYEGEPPLFDRLLLGEIMPAVEEDYRVQADRAHRALGGISRGGEWAIIMGGRHPELFGTIGGHSPAVGAPSTPNSYQVPLYANSRGQHLWLDVGSGDGLVAPVSALHEGWQAAGVVHEYHSSLGGHDRTYWGEQSEAYLRFYATSFGSP
jgi:enterochelin esterase-like enzyme